MSVKRIENLTLPMFNLVGRKEVTNLKSIEFLCQGISLKPNSIQEKGKFESEVTVGRNIVVENQKPLEACVNLGRYLEKRPRIIKDIASNYVRYVNLNKIRNEVWARPEEFNLHNFEIETINDNFNSFVIDDYIETDILSKKRMKIGSYHDKTLIRLVTKYLMYCGISEGEYLDYEEMQIITTEALLHIFDFCIEVYRDFNKMLAGDFDVNIAMNLQVTFKKVTTRDGKEDIIPIVEKRVTNLKSMIYLTMISHYRGKSIGTCKYCTDLFFGRKNREYCCENHSDLYNGKYKRRKDKERDKNISEEQI